MKTIFSFLAMILLLSACSKDSPNNMVGTESRSGQGGSLARFAAMGDYLYVVDRQDLKVLDASDPAAPQLIRTIHVGFGIETIFPYQGRLFLGAEDGMYVYDLADPAAPTRLSRYEHIQSCDPVVVRDTLAFVTLRSGTNCRFGAGVNELQVISVRDLRNPQLLEAYPLSSPYGLGVDGDLLFVCDANRGLIVYDISQAPELRELQTLSGTFYDVIPSRGNLIAVGPTHVHQYAYEPDGTMRLRSRIQIFN